MGVAGGGNSGKKRTGVLVIGGPKSEFDNSKRGWPPQLHSGIALY